MADLFAQLSVVSAILGGFAFTFVGALLGHPADKRVYRWVFGASLLAAMSFTVTALGSVLASLAARNAYPIDLSSVHQHVSLAFILGIFSFVSATGLCGWLKSRSLGLLSATIAVLSSAAVVIVLAPFLARA